MYRFWCKRAGVVCGGGCNPGDDAVKFAPKLRRVGVPVGLELGEVVDGDGCCEPDRGGSSGVVSCGGDGSEGGVWRGQRDGPGAQGVPVAQGLDGCPPGGKRALESR